MQRPGRGRDQFWVQGANEAGRTSKRCGNDAPWKPWKSQKQQRLFHCFHRAWKSGQKPKRRISTFPQRRRRDLSIKQNTKPRPKTQSPQQELSTLLRTGTFYFALKYHILYILLRNMRWPNRAPSTPGWKHRRLRRWGNRADLIRRLPLRLPTGFLWRGRVAVELEAYLCFASPIQRNCCDCSRPKCTRTRQQYCTTRSSIDFGR